MSRFLNLSQLKYSAKLRRVMDSVIYSLYRSSKTQEVCLNFLFTKLFEHQAKSMTYLITGWNYI